MSTQNTFPGESSFQINLTEPVPTVPIVQSQTGARSGRIEWGDLEIELLIRVMNGCHMPILRALSARLKGVLWDRVFGFFRNKLYAQGGSSPQFLINITNKKMKDKWNDLRGKFVDLCKGTRPTGIGGTHPNQEWEHFDDMAEVLKEDSSAVPEVTYQSMDENGNNGAYVLRREDIVNAGVHSRDLYDLYDEIKEYVGTPVETVAQQVEVEREAVQTVNVTQNEQHPRVTREQVEEEEEAGEEEGEVREQPRSRGVDGDDVAHPVLNEQFSNGLNAFKRVLDADHERSKGLLESIFREMEAFEERSAARHVANNSRMEQLMENQ
jgi:hypothetical protein